MKLGERRTLEGIWKRRYWKIFDASRRLTEEYENKLREYANTLQIIYDLASSDDVPQSKRPTARSLQDDKALDRTPQECEQRYKVIGAAPKYKDDPTARAVANAYGKHRELIWQTIGADAGVSSGEAEAIFWEIGRDGVNSAAVT